MLVAIIPVLVALVGLLLYALGDGKVARIGEILFAVGAFVTVWGLAGKVARLP